MRMSASTRLKWDPCQHAAEGCILAEKKGKSRTGQNGETEKWVFDSSSLFCSYTGGYRFIRYRFLL